MARPLRAPGPGSRIVYNTRIKNLYKVASPQRDGGVIQLFGLEIKSSQPGSHIVYNNRIKNLYEVASSQRDVKAKNIFGLGLRYK